MTPGPTESTVQESELLETAKEGSEDAYRRLVEPHRSELHAHCYRMLGSVQDAEDALQEALVRAWRGLPKFEGRSSLRSWLYRIAPNTPPPAIEPRPTPVSPGARGGGGGPCRSTTGRLPTRTAASGSRWSSRSGSSPIRTR